MKRIFYLTLFITSLFLLNTINVSAFSSENYKNRNLCGNFELSDNRFTTFSFSIDNIGNEDIDQITAIAIKHFFRIFAIRKFFCNKKNTN